jgi:lipopolysaccharide export LptBFGC system permease protein LptF
MRTGLRVGVSSVVPVLGRYVARGVAAHVLDGFAAVLAIFLMTRFSALLSDAAVGSLPSLLPAVLYLGALLAMNRLFRDRELLAMDAAALVCSWRSASGARHGAVGA